MTLLSGENQQARLALQSEQQREKNLRQAGLASEARSEADQQEMVVGAVQTALDNTMLKVVHQQDALETATSKFNALLEKLQVTLTTHNIFILTYFISRVYKKMMKL